MRIALLTEKYPPDIGGLAVSTERLARTLTASQHDVEAFAPTTRQAAGNVTRTDQGGIVVHRVVAHKRTDDTLADWFSLLVARHAETPFDLLHAYYVTQAGFVTTYAARHLGLPSIVSARGNDLDRAAFDPAKAAHVLYALQNASAITANSRDLVRKAQALAPGREVTLIPNGIDATHFAPAARDAALVESLGVKNDQSIIGFVGEARAKKGLATLLIAYRELASRRPAALLLIGGVRGGDDEDTLCVFQKQNPNLPVVVVPYVATESLPAYYNLLDVLAIPSLRDGLPNALLEGMACERAVVATPVGGIPDAIRDHENGRLVPPGDPHALAIAIGELLDDSSKRARLGQNARATILREFTPQQELEGNRTIYRRLLRSAD